MNGMYTVEQHRFLLNMPEQNKYLYQQFVCGASDTNKLLCVVVIPVLKKGVGILVKFFVGHISFYVVRLIIKCDNLTFDKLSIAERKSVNALLNFL